MVSDNRTYKIPNFFLVRSRILFGNVQRVLIGLLIISSALLSSGCKSEITQIGSPRPRTFRMGFSGIPPRADLNLTIAAINMWSQRADAAIMSYEVPWDSLLDGVPVERIVNRDLLGFANYFRAKGHQLWLYIDPANGLNRAGEADALVRRGRSITELAIQQLYQRWALVSDSIVRPEHLGLALETNLIRGASSPALYAAIRQAANDAATEIRVLDGTVKMSVSVQVDYTWGHFDSSGYHGVDTDFVHFPFIQELGLSSYPYLAGFTEPESVRIDYYSRLVAGRTIPVMVTEGGWTSISLGSIVSSPGKQRRWIDRQMQLLDSVRAIAVFQLTFTDLDLSAIQLPPGSILPLFAHLGLVDINLAPKPALGAWDEAFARPRQ
ncbi:MAG: hypothetical protein HYR76_09830 [Ignavibacteria bacterium]|nr:hypothetical protein [Ignavibacteria bacterium]MBI3766554.1 hypothetical protein [Ignavibacteriales bacterium]